MANNFVTFVSHYIALDIALGSFSYIADHFINDDPFSVEFVK